MACTPSHAHYCFAVLSAQLERRPVPPYTGDDADAEFPLFVTWNTVRPGGSTRLRGCIGNFSPMPLREGLQEYAIIAALKDRRFSPIALSELPKLECGVSLLTDFEDVDEPFDWNLGEHGIHIHFEDPAHAPPPQVESPSSMSSSGDNADSPGSATSLKDRLSSLKGNRQSGNAKARTLSATYLPDVAPAQGWTRTETLDSAMRKAGYDGKITDAIRQTVRVTRYRSSKVEVTYQQWKDTLP